VPLTESIREAVRRRRRPGTVLEGVEREEEAEAVERREEGRGAGGPEERRERNRD